MTLRERCKAHYQQSGVNAMLRQGDPVEDLVAFVVSEIGRAADERLETTLPLCLYFQDQGDRDEFIDLIRHAKPGMMMKQIGGDRR